MYKSYFLIIQYYYLIEILKPTFVIFILQNVYMNNDKKIFPEKHYLFCNLIPRDIGTLAIYMNAYNDSLKNKKIFHLNIVL